MEATRTFVLIKPDGVSRKLVGVILHRFELAGLSIVGLRGLRAQSSQVLAHCWGMLEKHGRKVFDRNVAFLGDGSVVAALLEGPDAVATARRVIGEMNNPGSGTVRGDYMFDTLSRAEEENRALQNLVHASDSAEAVESECSIWLGSKSGDVDGITMGE